jgi:hypothetical protein
MSEIHDAAGHPQWLHGASSSGRQRNGNRSSGPIYRHRPRRRKAGGLHGSMLYCGILNANGVAVIALSAVRRRIGAERLMRFDRRRGRTRSGNFKHDRRNVDTRILRNEFRIMVKAPAFLLLSLALGGCAVGPQARLSSDTTFTPARYAWDGAGGEDPNQPARSVERPHSARSVAAQDGTALDQDAQLGQKLVICKGCLRSPPPAEDSRLAKASD